MTKVFSILIFLWANSVIFGQTIYVNNAKIANGDGSSWAAAYNNLDDAILSSTSTSEIWIAKGTYLPQKDTTGNVNPADNRSKTFFINKNVKLFGGFLGSETLLSAANPTTNPTILSGDIGVANDSTDNAFHVIYITTNTNSIDNSTVLNGLTITKGFAGMPLVAGQNVHSGGGIYFNSIGNSKTTSPLITNCIFINNSARTGGACYFNIKGNTVVPIFTNCIFKNNYAGTSPSSLNGAGGAVRFDITGTVAAIFNNCLFEQNIAGSGGSIYNICYSGSSNLSLNNSYFIKNKANSGGVIYSCSNGATVVNKPVFTNTAFVENQGVNVGGVIYNIANNGETSSEAINCIFTKNSSSSGAAMYSRKATGAVCLPTIKNSIIWNITIANNEVVNNPTALSTSTLTNCIISDGVLDETISPSLANVFINCIEKDPLFKNTNNLLGSDAIWRTVDDGLNVQTNSPAINAGSNTNLPNAISPKWAKVTNSQAITTDITGVTNRIMEGIVDIGAFEFAAATPLPLTLIEFTAQPIFSDVVLIWKTTNEQNIEKFIIESSINGSTFQEIGQLRAQNLEKNEYEFITKNLANNDYYFRIKTIENNGKAIDSKILFVKIKENKSLKLVPNPAKDYVKITGELDSLNPDFVKIFDLKGNSIDFKLNSENEINISNLLKGVYFIRLNNNEILKLIKE